MAVQRAAEVPSMQEPDAFSHAPGSFKIRKSLPHHVAHQGQRNLPAFTNGSMIHSSPKSSRQTSSGSMSGTFPPNGLDSILPPTPPRQARDSTRASSLGHGTSHQNGLYHSSHQPRISSSPVRTQRPPTPDATPPATTTLGLPIQRAIAALSPESRADSFRTAKEEQSSGDESEGEFDSNHTGGAVKPVRQSSGDHVHGLDSERDGDSTPTPTKLKQASARNSSERSPLNGTDRFDTSAIPDREWDTNMMRNVTVRRKKKAPVSLNQAEEDEQRVAAREIVPKLFNGSSEDDDGPEPLTPTHDHFAQTMPSAQRQDERSKRYSGSSLTSTAVEAFIVPSSPQRRRTLRHVSKNLSLRSDDGSSRPSSNHASIASDELSMTQLNEKLRTEHAKRISGIHTPDPISSLPGVQLKHHPERMSLRLDGASLSDLARRRASEGTQTSSPSSSRHRTSSGSDFTSARTSDLAMHGRQHSSNGSRHSHYDSITKLQSQQPGSSSGQQQNLTRAATRRALQRLDSTGSTTDPRPISYPRETPRLKPVTTSMIETSLEKTEEPTVGNDPPNKDAPQEFADITNNDPVELEPEPLEHRETMESIPRVSFDESTIATHEMHRVSNASSNLRADSEHADARHLFAQSTPFSQISEHEIGEANAVPIYPHNNDSVLVVQHPAQASHSVVTPKSKDVLTPALAKPSLIVQPATPPQHLSGPANVDSPLKNPRRPPQPPQPSLMAPVINILPATPDHELERLSLHERSILTNSHPPTRSLSLVQRARRYSDTMIRPILAGSSTIKRTYSLRSRPLAPAGDRPSSSGHQTTQAMNLHPRWQPRGFWDEYSDSDSDWGEPEPRRARLPAGGDTTELGEPRGFAKVLDRAGFNRGGFLIGNSLGLERAGTNKQKPRIELPVGLGQRTSGRVAMPVKRSNSQHSLRSQNARRSVESLRQLAKSGRIGKPRPWDPRNWQVQYVGVGGMRDLWRHRQAEKRRRELKGKIGVRYSVENAPTSN